MSASRTTQAGTNPTGKLLCLHEKRHSFGKCCVQTASEPYPRRLDTTREKFMRENQAGFRSSRVDAGKNLRVQQISEHDPAIALLLDLKAD